MSFIDFYVENKRLKFVQKLLLVFFYVDISIRASFNKNRIRL